MITKLSGNIAFYFVKEGIIEEKDVDLYRYGTETVLSNISDIVIVLLSGIVFGKLLEAIWYYAVFCCLRKLSEGYHAKTFEKCKLLMIIMMCGVMMVSNIEIDINIWYIPASMVMLAFILHNVSLRCPKWIYMSVYFIIQILFINWKRNVAILTMCSFFIVGFASYIKSWKED